MKKQQLVDEMITLREEMRNINNRIQLQHYNKSLISPTNSQPSFIQHNLPDLNEKIKKYTYQLIELEISSFQKYFISQRYLIELLQNRKYEQMLEMTLKYIVKKMSQFIMEQSILKSHNSPANTEKMEKISKIIKEIVSPLQSKLTSQSKFYDFQLNTINKGCQTKTEPNQKQQFNIGLRQQSSILSSIQQESQCINSPKFNEGITNVIDEISFETSSIKKKINQKQYDSQSSQAQKNTDTNSEYAYNNNLTVLTTPKQQEFEENQLIMNTSNSSFKDTKRRLNKKPSQDLKGLLKQEKVRFPKKEIPPTMLSVDFIQKRKKTPEPKKKTYNIITNY